MLSEFEMGVLNDDPRYRELLQTVNARLAEQRANLARWETGGDISPIPEEVLAKTVSASHVKVQVMLNLFTDYLGTGA
jgi:hypothetical protein